MTMLVKFLIGCIIAGLIAFFLLMITAINLLSNEIRELEDAGVFDQDGYIDDNGDFHKYEKED